MSVRRTRAIAYGVVALLGAAAVLFTRPLPQSAIRPAAEVLSEEVVEDRWQERYDTLARGENLFSVLARGGVSEIVAREAIRAAKTLDPRRIPAGMPIRVRSAKEDSLPTEIILQLAIDRLLHLRRTETGWTGEEERLPWLTDTVVVDGVIRSNLYDAIDEGARDTFTTSARRQLAWALADIYEYRVDMTRDLRVGDSFRVLAERSVGPGGAMRPGRVIVANMRLSGSTIEAVRFNSTKVSGEFFDAQGRPLRSGFLRNPVEFRRISSVFGMRRHPILGTMRKHQGTDYAAAAGTPIRAIGDGMVIRAGWHNGYGNVVDIRHANGFVSRYAHMRRFASGVRVGTRVTREQIVGEVGSTGLSTAPHLHFEVHVHGVQRDPRVALRDVDSEPIPASERPEFAQLRTQFLAMMNAPSQFASADSSLVRAAR